MAKTRYLVRPQPRLQKLQRDIRRQFGTYKSTYLAKVDGAIRLPNGLFWVHDATGTDANGNTTYGAPRKMPMLPGAAIFPRPNTKVDVVTVQGIDYIARTNSFELERMGVDPHQSNTLDPVVQYKALDWIINLQAFKTPGASSTHIIGSIYKKPDGEYAVFPTTGGYDFVTANIPSTDNQVVVCQWINTDTNAVAVTVSSEESRDTDLKHPDNIATTMTLINECVAAAPTNHIGVNAWRIYDDTTIGTLDDNNKLADLRGIVGGGSASSFTLAGDTGTSQTVTNGDTLTVSGGVGLASVASATDTVTVNLDIPSLTADATPDGAADYVVTYDASTSTHKKVLLDNLPGGGTGMTSFTLAGDSGSSQTIGDGNTLTIAGGVGLASTASATDTVTVDLDVNSLTEDTTPDTSADFVATYDASATTHKKVKLSNLGGGSSGITHTYVGYNTAGGSNVAMGAGTVYMKKITLAAAGFLGSIGVYIDITTTTNVNGIACWVLTDNAGTPDLVRAVGTRLALQEFFITTTARWVELTVGVYLAAGDYWLCVQRPSDPGSDLRIYYDGSGSDKTQAIGNNWSADGSQYTISSTTNKYSIRGSILT